MLRRVLFKRTVLVCFLLPLLLSACQVILTPVPIATPTIPRAATSFRPTATPAPGLFLTPVPPTPTFTPVPTPTPVIYVVQSGDTFLGIAMEYGVSLEALLKANGLNVNEYLRIGQALIIPIASDNEMQPAAAPVSHLMLNTPTPLPLIVQGLALYHTPVGGMQGLGEVRNASDVPVTNLQLQVILSAVDGTSLAEQVVLAAADYLPPGEAAPFAALFSDPPAAAQDVQAKLLRGEPIGGVTASFVPMTVRDSQGQVSGPQYRVKGLVVNQSGGNVKEVRVVVTLYDDGDHVYGCRWLTLRGPLSVNESRSFEVLLTPQGTVPPTSFRVLAWAKKSG